MKREIGSEMANLETQGIKLSKQKKKLVSKIEIMREQSRAKQKQIAQNQR